MKQYASRLMILVLGVVVGLGISASTVEARKLCNAKRCKTAFKARCVGLKGKAKRTCRKKILKDCKAGVCSCTSEPSCAAPPTTTSTSTTVVTTTSTSSTSTSTTTLVSGACLVDFGDGTIHDTCSGLQWEKKSADPGLQNVDTLYSWAGCCDVNCTVLCQPNAAAAATCAALSDGGTEGCSTCAVGTCNVDSDMAGVPTTVWDWIDQLNAASFAGHNDWRLPSQAGSNVVGDAKELETIVDMTATQCGFGSPCIDALFGPTAVDSYFSATTISSSVGMAWSVDFGVGNVGSGSKQFGFFARAVR